MIDLVIELHIYIDNVRANPRFANLIRIADLAILKGGRQAESFFLSFGASTSKSGSNFVGCQ